MRDERMRVFFRIVASSPTRCPRAFTAPSYDCRIIYKPVLAGSVAGSQSDILDAPTRTQSIPLRRRRLFYGLFYQLLISSLSALQLAPEQ